MEPKGTCSGQVQQWAGRPRPLALLSPPSLTSDWALPSLALLPRSGGEGTAPPLGRGSPRGPTAAGLAPRNSDAVRES